MARRTCLTLILFSVAACGGDDDGNRDSGPDAISASCREAMDHSDLTWIQDRVFQPSCAGFSACHMGTAPDAGGLSLERGQTHLQTVGVDSDLFPQFKRVVAGDPANSYMMIIMGQYPGPIDSKAGMMPYNSPLLCKEKRDAVERWIAAGALDES